MKKSSVWLSRPVREVMTHAPQAVARDESLASAHERMQEIGVRHLPVLDDGGKLVGILSERDVLVTERLKGADPRTVPVEVAMTEDVYSVSPDTPLDEVVATMCNHKYGSAVVQRGSSIVGIFTTVDALRELTEELRRR